MDDSIAHEQFITTAPSSSEDTSNTNVIGHSNVNIVNASDDNQTHVGSDSRSVRDVVVDTGSDSG